VAYASISGRARTSSANPEAHAICDRCGFRYNWVDLRWQYDWRGPSLQNVRILVCKTCQDTPQEQLRAIVVPADPTPITDARVQDFVAASTDYQTTSGPTVIDPHTGIPIPSTTVVVDQNGDPVTLQPYGPPTGLVQAAQPPQKGTQLFAVKVPALSVTANGTPVVTVTCSAAHNLSSNAQVAIEGLTRPAACGFFSITVTSGTAFTYQTYDPIPAGALITPTTRVITASVGLPYGYTQIPQVP
jgi:hypothetical protein